MNNNHTKHAKINWSKVADIIGQVPDDQVAKKLGCSPAAVRGRRARLGIVLPYDIRFRQAKVSWSDHAGRLGKVSDSELAQELGVNVTTVRHQRRKQGISAFGR